MASSWIPAFHHALCLGCERETWRHWVCRGLISWLRERHAAGWFWLEQMLALYPHACMDSHMFFSLWLTSRLHWLLYHIDLRNKCQCHTDICWNWRNFHNISWKTKTVCIKLSATSWFLCFLGVNCDAQIPVCGDSGKFQIVPSRL